MINQSALKKYSIYFFALIILVLLVKYAAKNGDFKVYLEAAKLISKGKTPYHEWLFIDEGVYCQYFYSPLWGVLLIPFKNLPNFIPNFIWLGLNVYFLFRIGKLLSAYTDLKSVTKKQFKWIAGLTILMSFRFIFDNFTMIQMTIFLVWGGLESIRLIDEKKFIWGGLILAFVINVKILPVVIIPYLLYKKQFKGAVSTLFFSVVFLYLPALFIGSGTNEFLLVEWWSTINPGNSEHLLERQLGPHSITALIPSLLTETEGDLPFHRNLLNLDQHLAIRIMNIVRGLIVIATLLFLKSSDLKLNKLREISYLFLVIPLIFPHQQKYAFLFVLPVIYYLSYYLATDEQKHKSKFNRMRWNSIVALVVVSFILMTLSSDIFIGRYLNNLTQHFKTITWGSILLIFALGLASPSRMDKREVEF